MPLFALLLFATLPEPQLLNLIRKDAETYSVDRELVSKALADQSALEEVSLVPQEGPKGLRLLIPQYGTGVVLRALGLHFGDVITEVNGKPVGQPSDLPEKIKRSTTVKVTLWRLGEPIEITYKVGKVTRAKEALQPSIPTPRVSGGDLDKGIHKIDDAHYKLSRRLLQDVFSDQVGLAGSMRIVPSIRDGKANGFKLYAIRPNTFFSRIGLLNGDTIRAINGYAMTSPEQALETYTRIREAKTLTLMLNRRGKDLTIEYQIESN